jgi:radical SAM protein (TIGR01212 family)
VSAPPYLTYSRYLKERHGCTVHRVAVDAGFTCPNRGSDRSRGGCSYCDPGGSRAPYLSRNEPDQVLGCAGFEEQRMDAGSLERQVRDGMAFYRRAHGDGAFILYFQAYSNTNAPVDVLRRVYDTGLALGEFRGLNVATRPDCLDEEKADLLASYMEKGLEVWVELGLQSANDDTLRRIGRGHTVEEFVRSFDILRRRRLKVGVHLIFGLPGEGLAEIESTMTMLAGLRPDGVKIHNLHVPEGTPLGRDYLKGELTAPCAPRHIEYAISAIEMLPPETVIMRLTCDTPAEKLAAPRGFWTKDVFLARLEQTMQARGARQGRRYEMVRTGPAR